MIACHIPTGRWVPHGCETIPASVRRIRDALEGTGDVSLVETNRSAVAAILHAIELGQLSLLIFCRGGDGSSLSADVIREVPYFRRVLSLVYLRPVSPLYGEFAARFGIGFAQLALGFRRTEIEQLEIKIRRAKKDTRRVGRPPNADVRQEVKRAVEDGRWSISKSLKVLTDEVNRKLEPKVSDDTVGRALHRIWDDTNDSRFKRGRRKTR